MQKSALSLSCRGFWNLVCVPCSWISLSTNVLSVALGNQHSSSSRANTPGGFAWRSHNTGQDVKTAERLDRNIASTHKDNGSHFVFKIVSPAYLPLTETRVSHCLNSEPFFSWCDILHDITPGQLRELLFHPPTHTHAVRRCDFWLLLCFEICGLWQKKNSLIPKATPQNIYLYFLSRKKTTILLT